MLLTTIDVGFCGGVTERLREAGVLDVREAVENRVEVVITAPHGRTMRLHRGADSAFVRSGDVPGCSADLDRETRALRRLADAYPSAAGHTPRILDESDGMVFTELAERARAYAQHLEVPSPELARLGAAVGAALAVIHSVDVAGADAVGASSMPLALRLPGIGPELFASLSGAEIECLAEVQASALNEALRGLAQRWRRSSLVHGDIHPANILVIGGGPDGARIWLVDWEFAGVGEPMWDVGCLFAHHLARWIDSMPSGPEASAEAACPLECLQPALAAAWEAYTARRRLEDPEAELRPAVLATGGALVEIALARGQDGYQMDLHGRRLLQLAENILLRPADATRLMGLSAPGPPA